MPSHNLITDPDLHEPKGISTASEGMLYVADGDGSGEWKFWPLGKAYYQHGSTGQVITSTPTKLQINGAGSLTNATKLPREIRGSGQLWDTVNNKITPIRLYDGYLVRIDVPVTAESGTPSDFIMKFEIGPGSTVAVVAYEVYKKLGRALPYTISITTTLEALTQITVDNGIELFCSTNTGSVTLGSPGIYIQKTTDGEL